MYKREKKIMLHGIKKFFNENQEALPDLALIVLFFTPLCMTLSNHFTVIWMFIAPVFVIAGWIFATYKNAIGVLISLAILWIIAYGSTIYDLNDYGYGIGTLVLIPTLPYWLLSKCGFKKLIKESKHKKG